MNKLIPFLKISLNENSNLDRRSFIQNASKGLLVATLIPSDRKGIESNAALSRPGKDPVSVDLPPLEQPSEQEQAVKTSILEPGKRVGFAVIGLGNLSLGQILPAFGACKFSKLVALVSGSPDKAQKVAAQYGIDQKNVYSYQNFDSIKNNTEIDAVYVVLPNAMHEEYVVRAAAAGKHVLCEKPMTTSSKSAKRMIDACDKAGKKLMIAYRIQYEPHNKIAKEWARTVKYGQVKIIEAMNSQNIGDPAQWRLHKDLSGGGSLPDIGLYCLNTGRYILGEEPDQVIASMHSTEGDPRFKEVEESVFWQMHFPSGAIVNASCSYGVHQSRRYRCYADKGGWFGLDPAFDYEGLKFESSHAEGKQEIKQDISVKNQHQFALEMDHFASCIMQNKKPFTPGEEGLQDQKIMEAIYESAKTGKPVSLERIEKKDAFRGFEPENH